MLSLNGMGVVVGIGRMGGVDGILLFNLGGLIVIVLILVDNGFYDVVVFVFVGD